MSLLGSLTEHEKRFIYKTEGDPIVPTPLVGLTPALMTISWSSPLQLTLHNPCTPATPETTMPHGNRAPLCTYGWQVQEGTCESQVKVR